MKRSQQRVFAIKFARYLDKLIDELTKGKTMDKILRPRPPYTSLDTLDPRRRERPAKVLHRGGKQRAYKS